MKARLIVILAIVSGLLGTNVVAQSAEARSEQQRFKQAADYSRENRGLSVVVLKGDKIVFEEYQNGHSAERPWILASGTKSFSGVMLAAAIEDKLISGFDEKVSDTIVEWKADRSKAAITIRQLLSLTSGINAGQIGRVPSYTDAINEKVIATPGTEFEYGPVPFQIFGELMTRKLKSGNETVYEYLDRRILKPIGINVAFWRNSNGQPLLPQGASLTAREWLKFGQFLRDHGKWNGKQLIAKKLLDELVVGSKANPAYGLTFWLNRDGKGPAGRPGRRNAVMEISENGIASGLADMYMAAGAGNQRLYIIPSMDMVVVRQAAFGEWDDREFISRLISGKKLP
ncbi:MAG: beta-lactamase family protein [Pyrinomonadaceae bacterium]|nr:beta-lactamase family protein [Pyrinomonadaceae bacterium]